MRSIPIGSISVLCALVACGQRQEVAESDATRIPEPPPIDAPSIPTSDLLAIVQSIPPSAARAQMDAALERFLPALFGAPARDMVQAEEAVAALRDQPHVITSLVDYYDRLPATDHGARIMTLGVIGELQRTDAMAFLHRTTWAPLPQPEPMEEGPTRRELEEMVRVKAVQGIAYLRTAEPDQALVDIVRRHESRAVKIAAIDAYMWAHGDTNDAAQFLYKVVPPELHKFVERPRFHVGVDRKQFNEELKAWQARWGAAR